MEILLTLLACLFLPAAIYIAYKLLQIFIGSLIVCSAGVIYILAFLMEKWNAYCSK